MERVTGIFDIGKTNKKFLVFDSKLNKLHEENTQIEEVPDEDGVMWDNLEATAQWTKSTFKKIYQSKDFAFDRLNLTTFGASLVHLKKDGETFTPFYSYLKDFPKALKEKFFEQYGGELEICKTTASPSLGMLNSGLQLYWLKYKKPELFAKLATSLHLPQYISYLFTGKKLSERTSIGCHTMLWDFTKDDYHQWVKDELSTTILPQPTAANQLLAAKDYENLPVGIGLHDSSASLIPYLIGVKEKFALISTGTWSITLNPFSTEPLTETLLKADCLNFMSFEGKLVRASRLFLGHVHDKLAKQIVEKFGQSINEIYQIQPDLELIKAFVNTPAKWTKYTIDSKGHLQPHLPIDSFKNLSEAYHQLLFILTNLQKKALELAIGNTKIDTILIAGGFAKSQLFTKLLASILPSYKIYIAEVAQASALGAALAVQPDSQHKSDFQIEKIEVLPFF